MWGKGNKKKSTRRKEREVKQTDKQTNRQTENRKQKTENRKQKTLGFSKFIYKTMLRVELSEAFY